MDTRARGSHDKHGDKEKMTKTTIAVDVSKDHLDVHRWPDGGAARFGNDPAGYRKLIAWLEG